MLFSFIFKSILPLFEHMSEDPIMARTKSA
jgi:hypothetical protein